MFFGKAQGFGEPESVGDSGERQAASMSGCWPGARMARRRWLNAESRLAVSSRCSSERVMPT
ncbi:hypothetical protein D3C78_1625700 [compost metagenome]